MDSREKNIRRWPDAALVYDARSGDVHKLGAGYTDLLLDLEAFGVDASRIPLYRTLNLVENPTDLSDEDILAIVSDSRAQFLDAGLLN